MKNEPNRLKMVDSNSKLLHYGTRALVILIAVGAGVLSFDGLAQLAMIAGVRVELAYVWALVVDGFILVATFATFALKDRTDGDRIKKYYAWVILAIFVVISIFGNAMHSLPQDDAYTLPMWVKISVNAVPPIALFLAIHLIVIMVSPTSDEKKDRVAEQKRLEREERMRERKLLAAERLNEKEAQDIEKGTVRASLPKETPNSDNYSTYIPKKSTITEKHSILSEETIVSDQPEIITKDEAVSKLIELLQDEQKLPSGREVGEWVGLKERAGQNLLKKAKELHHSRELPASSL